MTIERDQILATLAGHRGEFAGRFGVRRLALFGSAARDELRPGSDIGVLVEFEGATTYEAYFATRCYARWLLLALIADVICSRDKLPSHFSRSAV